jgi:hypothetical protein
MRILSDAASTPNRIVFPVVNRFPDLPIIGEVLYFNAFPRQGLHIFNGEGWIPLYSSSNNIWETIIAEPEQVMFTLENHYNTDGKSIVVYKDGKRLMPHEYAEIGTNLISYKEQNEEGEDIELAGGEKFEFQLFNVKVLQPFDVKSFNRRVGIC